MEPVAELTKEQKNFAVDATVLLTVEQLSENSAEDPAVLLHRFVASGTGKLLYDESSKLWCCGPAYIADLYHEELRRKQAD